MGKEFIDLVYRLRGAHESSGQRILGSNIFAEAADEIERLHTENEKLRAENEELNDACNGIEWP